MVVTGIGMMVPHGDDPRQVFAALMRGESAVRVWRGVDAPRVVAATVPFNGDRWFSRLQVVGVDRVSQLAVAAAEAARSDAGLGSAAMGLAVDPERVGVYLGCSIGGAAAIDSAYRAIYAEGARVPPLAVPSGMTNAPAAHVAMRAGVHGPVITYSVACASSAVAIAEAAKSIVVGEIDVAIAGGSESPLVPGVVRAWQAMQTLAVPGDEHPERACKPFATDRSGFALGEGAAFLVLESEEHASARGAHRYARFSGAGITCDASHLTKPDANGQVRALRAALRTGGLTPADVCYCNAHGTATRVGDVVECEALATVWGEDLDALRVSSTKSMHGHLLGTAGALEAAITVLALQTRQVPPTAHCQDQDRACRIRLVRDGGQAMPALQAAISSSFAFGGTNAVLAFVRV